MEGIDVWGRVVSAAGIDPDALLMKCIADAKAMFITDEVTDKAGERQP